MFSREFFFGARIRLEDRRCSVGGWFFLFATERRITDNYYTDGRIPSMKPSGIISPTEFMPITDRISPSVKLFNGVVGHIKLILKWFNLFLLEDTLIISNILFYVLRKLI
jgi:hypothetical protein